MERHIVVVAEFLKHEFQTHLEHENSPVHEK